MNLMNVYLDAVFKPRCVTKEGEWVLRQEGWRYDVNDEGDLEVQGVVYNEMKGVYSDPLNVLDRQTEKLLFQDNTYAHDSGGNPSDIPALTQDDFVTFYRKHYHPTNSNIFISGDKNDIEAGMDMIHEYLSEYEYDPNVKINSQIQFQKKRFAHHLYQSHPYAVQEVLEYEGQHMLCITWLLNDQHMTPFENISWYVLDFLLFGASSSPLRKALTTSGLGTIIGNGYSSGLLQNTFSIGMMDVLHQNVVTVEDKIIEILRDIVRDGFEQDDIDAAVNSIEFELREGYYGNDPVGINVYLSILSKWNYEQPPEDALNYDSPLKMLKQHIQLQGSSFFTRMIQVYLLENNHRVHMELTPSENYEAETLEKEKNASKVFQDSLSDDQLNMVINSSKQLHTLQSTPDPPEIIEKIPALKVEELEKTGLEYDINIVEYAYGTEASVTACVVEGSSGITYIDVGIDVSSIPFDDIDLIPLLLKLLEENDTHSKSRLEFDRLEGIHTGGISVELVLSPLHGTDQLVKKNDTNMLSHIFFRGKCVVEKMDQLLDLMKILILEGKMVSPEQAIQMIEREISSFEGDMQSQGHSFAQMRMHSRYNTLSFLEEKLYGITQFISLKSFLVEAKTNWVVFEKRMKTLLDKLAFLYSDHLIINVTGDLDSLKKSEECLKSFVQSFPSSGGKIERLPSIHPWLSASLEIFDDDLFVHNEGIPISSQVSYIGLGGPLYMENEHLGGESCVPLQFLKKGYLWDEVRAKNGAYGVMASLDSHDGSLYMVSYRDPNLIKTLDAYKGSGDYLSTLIESGSITQKTIDTAIIGCIGALDGPSLSARDIGWLSFRRLLQNSSSYSRQSWRDEILSTNVSHFVSFADKLKNWKKDATIAAVAPESELAEASNAIDLLIIEM